MKLVILIISLALACNAENYETDEGIEISPNAEDIEVKEGDSLVLSCFGDQPLTWRLPKNVNEDPANVANMTISLSEDPDSSRPYGIRLEMFNITVYDVGFYTCLYNVTDELNLTSKELAEPTSSNQAKQIYLFVKDPKHPLVPTSTVIDGYESGQITIPCRPSSKDVNVTLFIDENEDNDFNYDLKRGFKYYFEDLRSDNYTCLATSENTVVNKQFRVKYTSGPTNLPKPIITDSSNEKVAIGGNITFECSVVMGYGTRFSINWKYPNEERIMGKDIFQSVLQSDKQPGNIFGNRTLTLVNANSNDKGNYYCTLITGYDSIQSVKYLNVLDLDAGEAFLNLTEPINQFESTRNSGTSQNWIVNINAFPFPEVEWYDNKNKKIDPILQSAKYVIKVNPKKDSEFMIKNITLADTGTYYVVANNKYLEERANYTLIVRQKAIVEMWNAKPNYYMHGTKASVQCKVTGFPTPEVKWTFQPCGDVDCDTLSPTRRELKPTEYVNYVADDKLSVRSIATLQTKESGFIFCHGKNLRGSDEKNSSFYVTDVINGFGFIGKTNNFAVGDDFNIVCAMSIYNNKGNRLVWYNKTSSLPLEESSKDGSIGVSYKNTPYSRQAVLSIKNAVKDLNGNYACTIEEKDGTLVAEETLALKILDLEAPFIYETNLNETEFKATLGQQEVIFYCRSRGTPQPIIKWYKDEVENFITNASRVRIDDSGEYLNFKWIMKEDQGTYKCVATNKVSQDLRSIELVITEEFKLAYIGIIIALLIVFVILVAALICKIIKEKALQRELKKAGLDHFREGATESLNPELGVDDQAELLPYDKKWEFPRDKLKLGKQLGSGAFGVVMKGTAHGLTTTEDSTTVAVKMVKKTADLAFIRALISELKIMIHLGKHLNVVNLLGACTKNVENRELLVIVEYCRFGNLHNYLIRHREHFIDQINHKTGHIDATIGSDELNRAYSVSSNKSSGLKSAMQPLLNSGGSKDSSGFVEMDTGNTLISMIPTGDDGTITSSGSAQPEWRSNYRGDYNYSREVRPISTKDLVCWSFQVARGMEYLANRKVLHGDLAARNILLSEDNIVKICDFGLAKSIYKNDNYKKKGDGLLPVKWMAIESIRDRIFSIQSDVWSFGIVMWEFFSLAKTPYPGFTADEKFYNSLIDGYRMKMPQYANERLYKIMTDCWLANPKQRPSFTELTNRLGTMLEEGVRQYYIDLNDPYVDMNCTWLKEKGENDYLAMMSSPDYNNLTSAQHEYVNEQFGGSSKTNKLSPDEIDDEGYLRMSPASNTLVSKDNDVFVFVPSRKHESIKEKEESNGKFESVPLCNLTTNNSNTDGSEHYDIPKIPVSPGVPNLTDHPVNNNCDKISTYVNLNELNRHGNIETKNAFSNPNYIPIQNYKNLPNEIDGIV